MTYAQGLRRGTSLAFNRKIDINTLNKIKAVGISSVELSFGYDYYMNQIDFPRNCEKYKVMAREAGIELWSIHLPFSANLDISHPDDELWAITMHTNRTMIEAASRAGIKVAVLHPSSEPITDSERPDRMKRSSESISLLQSQCEPLGLKLAVENLPRTCLCNRAVEMVELLQGTGAGIVFDTNHSLIEDNVSLLTTLVDSGISLHSLHISEYSELSMFPFWLGSFGVCRQLNLYF